MDQVPEGPRAGAGTWPERLPAAALPETPAHQREYQVVTRTATPLPCPHSWPLGLGTTARGPCVSECQHALCPSASCCLGSSRIPASATVLFLSRGRRAMRARNCPQGWPPGVDLMGTLVLGSGIMGRDWCLTCSPEEGTGDGGLGVKGEKEGVRGRSSSLSRGRGT